METPAQVQPKKSNTGLIIGIVAVVLVCCCCVLAIGAFLLMGPAVGRVFSSINQQLTTPVPGGINSPTPGSGNPSSGLVPEGGLGDETLRTSTWAYVMIASAALQCSSDPSGSDTSIEVTQQPDSTGVWVEQWTVTCDDGSKKPFDVTFTPSASGGTDINVKAAK